MSRDKESFFDRPATTCTMFYQQVAGAAPDYLYWYSYIAWWVMENGEEWRAEDISSPIRFCVWLTKTKKEYVCTTIFWDWCQVRNCCAWGCSSGHYINGEGLWPVCQWRMESHPASRNPAARATVPSPGTLAWWEWTVMEVHGPRYGDYGQWSLRIIRWSSREGLWQEQTRAHLTWYAY